MDLKNVDFTTVITYVTYAVTAASAAAAVLPHGAPGSKWESIRAIIDALAINLGKAQPIKKPPLVKE